MSVSGGKSEGDIGNLLSCMDKGSIPLLSAADTGTAAVPTLKLNCKYNKKGTVMMLKQSLFEFQRIDIRANVRAR